MENAKISEKTKKILCYLGIIISLICTVIITAYVSLAFFGNNDQVVENIVLKNGVTVNTTTTVSSGNISVVPNQLTTVNAVASVQPFLDDDNLAITNALIRAKLNLVTSASGYEVNVISATNVAGQTFYWRSYFDGYYYLVNTNATSEMLATINVLADGQDVPFNVEVLAPSYLNNGDQNREYVFEVTFCVIQNQLYDGFGGVIDNTIENATPIFTSVDIVPNNNRELTNYEIKGNSVLSNTPSLEQPQEIRSVGEPTDNMYNPATISLSNSTVDGEVITLKNTNSTYDHLITTVNLLPKIQLEPSTTYAITIECLQNNLTKQLRFIQQQTSASTTIWLPASTTLFEPGQTGVKKFVATTTSTLGEKYGIWICHTIESTANLTAQIKIHIEESDTVKDYQPYGQYKIPIVTSGKNILNPVPLFDNSNWFTSGYKKYKLNVEPGKHYVFSVEKNIIFGYNVGGTPNKSYVLLTNYRDYGGSSFNGGWGRWIGHATANLTSFSIAFTGEENVYLAVAGAVSSNLNLLTTLLGNMQLEEGTVQTPYQAYQEEVVKNIIIDQPLRSCGDVADTIDFTTGKITRRIGYHTLTGNEIDWSYVTNTDANWCSVWANNTKFLSNGMDLKVAYGSGVIFSTHVPFVYDSAYYGSRSTLGFMGYNDSTAALMFTLPKSMFSNAASWKNWLIAQNNAGTPLTLQFILQTPLISDIQVPPLNVYDGFTKYYIKTSVGIQPLMSITL